jgi:hypothetical protein
MLDARIKRAVTLVPLLRPNELEKSTQHKCMARYKLSRAVDWTRVQKWINNCDNHGHMQLSASPGRSLDSFRCIDVEQDCLSTESLGCKFAALSYTWGSGGQLQLKHKNMRDLYRSGSLKNNLKNLSLVVRHAIRVCRELKISFLWVDALCIVQDDDNDKHHQIKNMNQVCHIISHRYG